MEQMGWETTIRWVRWWSVDIWRMIEDLVGRLAAREHEATDSISPEILMQTYLGGPVVIFPWL